MSSDRVKFIFIKRCLDDYLKRVITDGQKAIVTLDANKTGDLKGSFLGASTSNQDNFEGQAKLYFNEYGRMVDMGAGAGVKRAGVKLSAKQKREKNKLRKPKKFYSPIAYGHLNKLISDLSYGLTEEVIDNIKKTHNVS